MPSFTTLTSRYVVLPSPDVDTDQIIPARFLKTTDKVGLGGALFADWRYGPGGEPRADFPLNRPEARGAEILVAGHNFGCGSSREHAAWALQGFGFRAVISTRFADIFYANALKNGLLPVVVDPDVHARLVRWHEADPSATLAIDLERETLTLPNGTRASFPIDRFAKRCLLTGVDELGFLLSQAGAIADYESAHPAHVRTTTT